MSKPAVLFGGNVATTPFATLLSEPISARRKLSNGDKLRLSMQEVRRKAREEGYSEGRSEGYAAGLAEGHAEGMRRGKAEAEAEFGSATRAKLAELGVDLATIRDDVQIALERYCQQAEDRLESIVVEIARRVIGQELTMNPEATRAIVKSALAEVKLSTNARIRLNPFHAASLREHQAEIVASAATVRNVEIVDDPEIAQGCVIETDGGTLDATVEGQLAQLENNLEAA